MKIQISLALGIVLLMLLSESTVAQAYRNAIDPDNYKGDFRELSRQIDMFYDSATGSNKGGFKQWKRMEWFAIHHLDENGKLANIPENNMNGIAQSNKLSATNSRMSHTGDWVNLGHSSTPGTMAQQGRVNTVAFDPVNSSIVYAGAAGGGIWKSFNNGQTWTNLTVDLPILGISDIVVAPAPNNNIVYALTGDVVFANIYLHYSIGIIKSYDGGITWVRTNLTSTVDQQLGGNKLLMSPANQNVLLTASTDGIYRTMNGGDTWTQIVSGANVNDMEYKPNDPNTLYFTAIGVDSLYTMNLTTQVLSVTMINTTTPCDRMMVEVTPDNSNVVYVLAGPGYVSGGMNLFNGLFKSSNSGASFSMISNACVNNGDLFNSARSISFYANTILVDPNEENTVIAGGLNLFRSTDGGINLQQVTSNSIHSDQHNLKRNPLNGDLWLCNDGGVYRSTDNGNTWNDRSDGLVITEYYRISGTGYLDDLVLCGSQDNGHFLIDASGNFQSVLGGDGMDNYFNSFDNTIAYACQQNGGLKKSLNYGLSFGNSSLPNSGNANFYPWITPIVQHPPQYIPPFWINTDVIYVYSLNGIMRSTDGFSWTNIGPTGNGQVLNSLCPSMAIGAAADGSTNLYISNGNSFWVCFNPLDNTPTWNLFSVPINNNTYISAMAVNPAVRTEIWITISGYLDGTKVFRSQNSGVTWSNLSLSLPNTPVYSIVFANNANSPSGAVYVGTEIGVFYTDDGIPDWVPFSNGLPHVPVTDMSMNYFTGELKCATYGRGIWESDVYQVCPSLVLLDYDINQGQYSYESSGLLQANHFISGGLGTNVHMKAANKVKLVNGFRADANTYVRVSIGACGSGVIELTDDDTRSASMTESIKVKALKADGH